MAIMTRVHTLAMRRFPGGCGRPITSPGAGACSAGQSGVGGREMSDGRQGWHPDPYGRHEIRYFSGGMATYLVRDGQIEGSDPVELFLSASTAAPPVETTPLIEVAPPVEAPPAFEAPPVDVAPPVEATPAFEATAAALGAVLPIESVPAAPAPIAEPVAAARLEAALELEEIGWALPRPAAVPARARAERETHPRRPAGRVAGAIGAALAALVLLAVCRRKRRR